MNYCCCSKYFLVYVAINVLFENVLSHSSMSLLFPFHFQIALLCQQLYHGIKVVSESEKKMMKTCLNSTFSNRAFITTYMREYFEHYLHDIGILLLLYKMYLLLLVPKSNLNHLLKDNLLRKELIEKLTEYKNKNDRKWILI